jgi:hypothetical protein
MSIYLQSIEFRSRVSFSTFHCFHFHLAFSSHNNGWNISSKCEKSKSLSGTVALHHLWTSSDKVFKVMTGDFGTESPLSLFSAYCFISDAFMTWYLPERKRKTIGELKQNKWIWTNANQKLKYIKIIMCRGLKIVLNVMQKILNILDENVTLIARIFHDSRK